MNIHPSTRTERLQLSIQLTAVYSFTLCSCPGMPTLDAYLFSFEFGGERFGNHMGILRGPLNYAMSTDLGLEWKKRQEELSKYFHLKVPLGTLSLKLVTKGNYHFALFTGMTNPDKVNHPSRRLSFLCRERAEITTL